MLLLKILFLSLAFAESDPRANMGSSGAVVNGGSTTACSCKQDAPLKSTLSYVSWEGTAKAIDAKSSDKKPNTTR